MPLFAAGAAELFVRYANPQNLSGNWQQHTDRGLRVNRSDGTARHQRGDRVVEYRFSPPHLRGPSPTEGPLRVLVLGASFTFGWLVEEQHTFVQQLQRRADDRFGDGVFQLLNAGVGGWGATEYAAFFDDFGEQLAPDAVIVFLHVDDIREQSHSPFYALDSSGNLVRREERVGGLRELVARSRTYRWLMEHSHLAHLVRDGMLSTRIGNAKSRDHDRYSSVSTAEAVKLGQALFTHLAEACRRQDTLLLVLTTGWDAGPLEGDPTRAFLDSAPSLFSQLSVPYRDLSTRAEFGDTGSLVIDGDGHPNERGHELIARAAWEELLMAELTVLCERTHRCGPNIRKPGSRG